MLRLWSCSFGAAHIDGTKLTELTAQLGIVLRNCSVGLTKLIGLLIQLHAPRRCTSNPIGRSQQKCTTQQHERLQMQWQRRRGRRREHRMATGRCYRMSASVAKECGTSDATPYFAVGIVIELDRGVVLDYDATSNYCHGYSGQKSAEKDINSCKTTSLNAKTISTARPTLRRYAKQGRSASRWNSASSSARPCSATAS